MFNRVSVSNPFNQDRTDDQGKIKASFDSELVGYSDFQDSGKYPQDSIRKHKKKKS